MTATSITSTTSTPTAAATQDSSADNKDKREAKGISTASSIGPAALGGSSWTVMKQPDYIYHDGSSYGSPYFGPLDKAGLPSGFGQVSYTRGGYYSGAFLRGTKEGHGTQVEPDGKKYVGQFSGDQYHGEGVLITPANEKFDGDFVMGEFKKGKHYPDFVNHPDKCEEYVEVPASKCIIS